MSLLQIAVFASGFVIVWCAILAWKSMRRFVNDDEEDIKARVRSRFNPSLFTEIKNRIANDEIIEAKQRKE